MTLKAIGGCRLHHQFLTRSRLIDTPRAALKAAANDDNTGLAPRIPFGDSFEVTFAGTCDRTEARTRTIFEIHFNLVVKVSSVGVSASLVITGILGGRAGYKFGDEILQPRIFLSVLLGYHSEAVLLDLSDGGLSDDMGSLRAKIEHVSSTSKKCFEKGEGPDGLVWKMVPLSGGKQFRNARTCGTLMLLPRPPRGNGTRGIGVDILQTAYDLECHKFTRRELSEDYGIAPWLLCGTLLPGKGWGKFIALLDAGSAASGNPASFDAGSATTGNPILLTPPCPKSCSPVRIRHYAMAGELQFAMDLPEYDWNYSWSFPKAGCICLNLKEWKSGDGFVFPNAWYTSYLRMVDDEGHLTIATPIRQWKYQMSEGLIQRN
ncbi:hypothetical protein V8E53_001352 [Lactarius tabidus]